jgi:hypothetical protein
MTHFAKIEDNVVTQVIVAEQDFIDTQEGTWVQTLHNTPGVNYAGIGYIYDSSRDAFIEPQPYPSWTLNEDTCAWDPPVTYPDDFDDKFYCWDEGAYQAYKSTGWVEID